MACMEEPRAVGDLVHVGDVLCAEPWDSCAGPAWEGDKQHAKHVRG
jgi:hypothetical protein